ncbi:tetratricopeptide repeat protein [Ktedonobacter racemifer]|nr:tetratricopeptide repeat protein [Ktedonobacter racemifer]
MERNSHTNSISSPRLPLQMTATIGREQEIHAVSSQLRMENTRLVTLTGPGGVGKTRLSLEIARTLQDAFPRSIFFVSLAPLREREQILLAIASAFGVHEGGKETLTERLEAYLNERRCLLLLDNFEHLLKGADLVAELLATAPQLKILVTSREPLHLYGEQEIEVLPLPLPRQAENAYVPREESAALRLFVERAQAVKPSFTLTQENYATIAEICQRLDGLPLALELAAARIKILSPQALLTRLSSRLTLLVGGPRNLPQRQQTLRNALNWSYDLLTEAERRAFRRLGSLIGTWDLGAAAACMAISSESEALEMLSSLVDKSLVRSLASERDEPHFMLLETLHEYACASLQQSGEQEESEHGHANYYLRLAEEADANMRGSEQQHWLARLDQESPNLLLALHRVLVRQNAQLALRLGSALSDYLLLRHTQSTQHNWLEEILALDASAELHSYRARILYVAVCQARLQGNTARASQRLEECLELAERVDDLRVRALALSELGMLAMQRGEYARARELAMQGIQVLSTTSDKWGKSALHRIYGNIASKQGDVDAAQTHYLLSLMLLREVGEKRGLAEVYISLATIMHLRGKLRSAHYLYQRGLNYFEALEDRWGQVRCLNGTGAAYSAQGAYAEANKYLGQALTLAQQLGDREGQASALSYLAMARLNQWQEGKEQLSEIATTLKESLRLANELKNLPGKAYTLLALGEVERLCDNSPSAQAYYNQCLDLAQRMNDKLTHTRILCAQGRLALEQGEYQLACTLLKESIQLAWQTGNHVALAGELESVAQLCLDSRQPELAVQLLASAHSLREKLQTPLPPIHQARHQQLYTNLKKEISAETWSESWNVGCALLLAQVVDLVSHITILTQDTTKTQSITPSSANAFHLTARECEVLRLLALGHPDARIAQELVLSRRTVNTHLRSIYAKLGVSTRTAAARVAFEQQLA